MGTKFYKTEIDLLDFYHSFYKTAGKYFLTLFVFLALHLSGYSQTNLTFTTIPVGPTNALGPGRGAQYWNNAPWDDVYDPTIPSGNTKPLNRYYRFNWVDLENTNTQGSYDFSIFDAQMNAAIDGGQMFTFGIMAFCSACGLPNYGYPTYVHNGMQAEAAANRDWQNPNGFWVPNYHSNTWRTRYTALLSAVANHIATSSHSGHSYTSAFLGFDMRHYSDFGEGNGFPTGTCPASAQITDADMIYYTDQAIAIFPNVQLTIPMSYVAPNDNYSNAAGNTGTQAAYHVLTASNNYGRIGWRRDNIGDEGYNSYLTGTTAQYNPGTGNVPLLPLIMNNWQVAPVGGEPAIDLAALTRGGPIMFGLHNENTLFHMSYFGNGNYPVIASDATYGATLTAAIRAGSAEAGYNLVLDGGSTTTSPSAGGPFNITLQWKNVGLAPVYEKWNVTYELRNGASVVWTGASNFSPRLFLPKSTDSVVSDNLTLTSVTPGTYSLYLVIRDPAGYKQPLPLSITGRQSDGSYLLRNNITVVTGTGNQPPTAAAGSNQTIQLPTSTASLAGTGTDPDGTISTYQWTKVSGPTGGAITNANAASTPVTALTQGVYVYKLTVTDNLGATGTATVQITVNAASGGPFAVNAGPDQTLAAGTTTAALAGTVPASIPAGPTADTANLIVIWGESNAAGNAANSSALASELASRSSVQIYDHNTGAFTNLQIGVNNEQDTYIDNTHHGLELGLANEVEAGRLKGPTYLVKIGVSGSYICQWLHSDGLTCRPSGNLWDGWIPLVDGAVAKMNALGKPFRIVVWQSLGLNDLYSVATPSATFVAKMATFRSDFRARFGANIPFLGTDFNNPPAQSYAWSNLFTQMATSDPRFFSIPVTGATYMDAGVHYDYAGMKLVAHNMVNTMLTLGEGPASGTGTGTTYTSTWSKVSGPAGGAITTPAAANTGLTGLIAGTYVFRLTVKDNTGVTVSDDVQITVNAATNNPPVANAGIDQGITLPTNSVTVNGSASNDTDGSIASYSWTEISGPAQFTITNSSAATTTVTNLVAGQYAFQLKVTDNLGATGLDTVKINVSPAPVNQPPVSNAGPDQSITLPTNSVTLNGSASSDPDGSIASYLWTKISGPAQFTLGNNSTASTLLSNLTAGLYSFQLKVTDNGGAIALDTVKINVNAAPANQLPVANAGADITITLPTNIANLNGSGSSDPDGTIAAYAWSQVSGPAIATISTATAVSTGLTGLQQGVYIFSLKVTDNSGAINLDSVKVTVNPAPNMPPVANAGASKTITLPVNSTNLDGSLSSDPDGTISSYAWVQIAGPSASTITGAATSVATASGMVAGLYTFQLTVMDNKGATANATVKITVVSATPQPPIANAGGDQTITLPVNSATINGSASSASSGSIVSYVWTETSGPTVVGLSNTAINTLNNLQAGVYTFSLTVTDNNGATGTDAVTITVNAAANQAPVANAGLSISLTLPTNSTSLDGTKSADPDGTISAYSWTLISGPNTPGIAGANTASANITGLIAGQYTYQLTVTDNKGLSSSAQVKIIVTPAANVLPVANAGANQSITAPASTVSLNGTASNDPDGTITAYSWITVSGPGSVTISNSNTATPTATGLTTGVYIFELTVTDNSGATAKDQVTVVVNPKPVLPNQAPVANAGTNQTISVPTNSTSLNGTSSFDPDGTITNYAWTQISGPNSSVITSGNSATPTVSQLIVGQYVFQLTVTDNNGTSNTDQVTITVNPGVGKVNIPPVANAGISDTVTLPVNTYTLDASGSSDPDGTIDTYQWSQLSGPNTATSSAMNSAQVTVGSLQAGEYEFEVTVTDNAGATSIANMHLTVDPGSTVNDKLVLFPNPAHQMIHTKVTSTVTGTVKIYVYDMNGKLVAVTEAEKYGDVLYKEVNISGLAPGMYTAQIVIANQKTMVAKFIKY